MGCGATAPPFLKKEWDCPTNPFPIFWGVNFVKSSHPRLALNKSKKMIFYSKSERETFIFAKKIANKVKLGDIFLIEGALGVGKSVFVRGIASGLGVNEPMPSPSFTIVNEYKGKFPVYHFDFYRINEPFELYEIGFEDYIYSNGVSFIEWPAKGGELVPVNAIKVKMKIVGEEREIKIQWNR